METAFENLIYESDDSISSKGSTKSGSKRRSSRVSMIKSECLPTRRSGRLQKRQESGEDDKDKSAKGPDDTAQASSRAKMMKTKQKLSTLDDDVEKVLGATTVNDQLKLCILLKGETKPKLITAEEAKQKYPFHVLDFYESCLVWESDEETVVEEADDDDDEDKVLASLLKP